MQFGDYLKTAGTPQLSGPTPEAKQEKSWWQWEPEWWTGTKARLQREAEGRFMEASDFSKDVRIPEEEQSWTSKNIPGAGIVSAWFNLGRIPTVGLGNMLYRESQGLTEDAPFKLSDVAANAPISTTPGPPVDPMMDAKYAQAVEAWKSGNKDQAFALLKEWKTMGGLSGGLKSGAIEMMMDPGMYAAPQSKLVAAGIAPEMVEGFGRGAVRAAQTGMEKGFTSPEFRSELAEPLISGAFLGAMGAGHAKDFASLGERFKGRTAGPKEATLSTADVATQRPAGGETLALQEELFNAQREASPVPPEIQQRLSEALARGADTINQMRGQVPTAEGGKSMAFEGAGDVKFAELTPEMLEGHPNAEALLRKRAFTVGDTVYITPEGFAQILRAKDTKGMTDNLLKLLSHETGSHAMGVEEALPTQRFDPITGEAAGEGIGSMGGHAGDVRKATDLPSADVAGEYRTQLIEQALRKNPEFANILRVLEQNPEMAKALYEPGKDIGSRTHIGDVVDIAEAATGRGTGAGGRKLRQEEVVTEPYVSKEKAPVKEIARGEEEDTVTVYRGSETADKGPFWTTDKSRAASYGKGEVEAIDVPREVFLRGQAEAKRQGQPTGKDTVLPREWDAKARVEKAEPDVVEVTDEGDTDAFLKSLGVKKEIGAGESRDETKSFMADYFARKYKDLAPAERSAKLKADLERLTKNGEISKDVAKGLLGKVQTIVRKGVPEIKKPQEAAPPVEEPIKPPPGYTPSPEAKAAGVPKSEPATRSVAEVVGARGHRHAPESPQERTAVLETILKTGGMTPENLQRHGLTPEGFKGWLNTIRANVKNPAYDRARAIIMDPEFNRAARGARKGTGSMRELGVSPRAIKAAVTGVPIENLPKSTAAQFGNVTSGAHVVEGQRLTRDVKNTVRSAVNSGDPAKMQEAASLGERAMNRFRTLYDRLRGSMTPGQERNFQQQIEGQKKAVDRAKAGIERQKAIEERAVKKHEKKIEAAKVTEEKERILAEIRALREAPALAKPAAEKRTKPVSKADEEAAAKLFENWEGKEIAAGERAAKLSAAEAKREAEKLAEEVRERRRLATIEGRKEAEKQERADVADTAQRDIELGKRGRFAGVVKKGEVIPRFSAKKSVTKSLVQKLMGKKPAPGELRKPVATDSPIAGQAIENINRGVGQGRSYRPRVGMRDGEPVEVTPSTTKTSYEVSDRATSKAVLEATKKNREAAEKARKAAAIREEREKATRTGAYTEGTKEAKPLTEGPVTRLRGRVLVGEHVRGMARLAKLFGRAGRIANRSSILSSNARKLFDNITAQVKMGIKDPKAIIEENNKFLTTELAKNNRALTPDLISMLKGKTPKELMRIIEEHSALADMMGKKAGEKASERWTKEELDRRIEEGVREHDAIMDQFFSEIDSNFLHSAARLKKEKVSKGTYENLNDIIEGYDPRNIELDTNMEYEFDVNRYKKYRANIRERIRKEFEQEMAAREDERATTEGSPYRPKLQAMMDKVFPYEAGSIIPRGQRLKVTKYGKIQGRRMSGEAEDWLRREYIKQGLSPEAAEIAAGKGKGAGKAAKARQEAIDRGEDPDLLKTEMYETYEGPRRLPSSILHITGPKPVGRAKIKKFAGSGFERTLSAEEGTQVDTKGGVFAEGKWKTSGGKQGFGKHSSLGKVAERQNIAFREPVDKAIVEMLDAFSGESFSQNVLPRLGTGKRSTATITPLRGVERRETFGKIVKMATESKSDIEFTSRLDGLIHNLVAEHRLAPGKDVADFRQKARNLQAKLRSSIETPRQTAERVLGKVDIALDKVKEIGGGERQPTPFEKAGREEFQKKPLNDRVAALEEALGVAEKYSGVAKGALTGLDISNPGRQTLFLTSRQAIHEPRALGRALKEMVLSYSAKKHSEFVHSLKKHPRYADAVHAGLRMSKELTDHDNFKGIDLMAKWIAAGRKHSPKDVRRWMAEIGEYGIQGAGRAYTHYQNKIMLDTWTKGMELLEKNGKGRDVTAIREMTNLINMFGARSKVKTEALGRAGNVVFFSPQMIKSRMKTVYQNFGIPFETHLPKVKIPVLEKTIDPNWVISGGKEFTNKEVRQFGHEAVRDTIMLGAGITALVAGAASSMGYNPKLETDPRSTDFMKLRIGHTTFNPWGDHQQYLRVAAQMITESEKLRGSGRVQKANRANIASRAARGKLSPVASLAVSLLTGSTGAGRETQTMGGKFKALGETVIPLAPGDTYDIIKEHPNALAPLLIAMSEIGFSVQAGAAGKPWLTDLASRETDVRVSDEISRLKLEPPRIGSRVPLKGRNVIGQRLYYSLSGAEREQFQNEVMPIISKDIDALITSDRYKALNDDAKRRLLFRVIKRENRRYSAAKKLKRTYAGSPPVNVWWNEED